MNIAENASYHSTYWMLKSNLYKRIAVSGHPERDKRIERDAAKTRVLSI